MKPLALFIVLSLITVLADEASAQSLVCLGDLGGGASYASSINDAGLVVGYSSTGGGASYGFIYQDGRLTSLGAFGGTGSKATCISNANEVTGYYFTSAGATNGFVWSSGTMANIGALSTAQNYSVASAVNSAGILAGWSTASTGTINAVSAAHGALSSLGANSFAFGINKTGEIVGVSQVNGYPMAFLYANGTMANIGTLGGHNSYANAINDAGQVVGDSVAPDANVYAFLFAKGVLYNLGALPNDQGSRANGINNAGQIVGVSNGLQSTAFVYASATGMQSLNALYPGLLVNGQDSRTGFMSLTDARAINNSGQIVGNGVYWNGVAQETEAFLLSPTAANPATDTPTMPVWGLIALGVILMGMASRFLPEREMV
jgi:probable HAF family extracellular repeat protein